MMRRQHYFYSVTLKSISAEKYAMEVKQWATPFGLIIHCLFWFHRAGQANTNDAGAKWTCIDCLLSEYHRSK